MDDTDRRGFIRSFAMALLAVAGGRLVAGCRRAGSGEDAAHPETAAAEANETGTAPAGPPDTATPQDAGAAGAAPDAEDDDGGTEPHETAGATDRETPRDRIRALWRELVPEPTPEDWIAVQRDGTADPRPAREAAHRQALDELVADRTLRAPVANLLQIAFVEASFHAWRLRIGATCYDPTQFGWRMQQSRERLRERAELIDEWARSGNASDDLVAEARTELAKEIAVYEAAAALTDLQGESRWTRERALVERLEAGEITPDDDEREAAAALVDLLLDRPQP